MVFSDRALLYRENTLNILKSRPALVVLSTLVVIECLCVLAELMVDLQTIRLRFENEESELSKFVDFLQKAYPGKFHENSNIPLEQLLHELKTARIQWCPKSNSTCTCTCSTQNSAQSSVRSDSKSDNRNANEVISNRRGRRSVKMAEHSRGRNVAETETLSTFLRSKNKNGSSLNMTPSPQKAIQVNSLPEDINILSGKRANYVRDFIKQAEVVFQLAKNAQFIERWDILTRTRRRRSKTGNNGSFFRVNGQCINLLRRIYSDLSDNVINSNYARFASSDNGVALNRKSQEMPTFLKPDSDELSESESIWRFVPLNEINHKAFKQNSSRCSEADVPLNNGKITGRYLKRKLKGTKKSIFQLTNTSSSKAEESSHTFKSHKPHSGLEKSQNSSGVRFIMENAASKNVKMNENRLFKTASKTPEIDLTKVERKLTSKQSDGIHLMDVLLWSTPPIDIQSSAPNTGDRMKLIRGSSENIHPVRVPKNRGFVENSSVLRRAQPSVNNPGELFLRRNRRSVENDSMEQGNSGQDQKVFVIQIHNSDNTFYMLGYIFPEAANSSFKQEEKINSAYNGLRLASKGLHFGSISILAVMVAEAIVKMLCRGKYFFKKKFEMFDAFIVLASFLLDFVFQDSRWYETGKDAATILVLLLPWRVVRIVNSFLMTMNHKHKIEKMTIQRGRKKAESKLIKLQSLVGEMQRDVELLAGLCRNRGIPEEEVTSCIYGRGRLGTTMTAISSFASLMLISTLGKDGLSYEGIYHSMIQDALHDPSDDETKARKVGRWSRRKQQSQARDGSRTKSHLGVRKSSSVLSNGHVTGEGRDKREVYFVCNGRLDSSASPQPSQASIEDLPAAPRLVNSASFSEYQNIMAAIDSATEVTYL